MHIRLRVEEHEEDEEVSEHEIEASTGEEVFQAMEALCRFELWARADVLAGRNHYEVSNDRDGTAKREDAKKVLQEIMEVVGASGFLLQVQKKEDEQSDGPAGPYRAEHPGFRPRSGPGGDGLETPAGPDATLARMRGVVSLL